jgi:hypothetical protein
MLQVNQLQSELRLARSLIAERDAEIQRVRTTNNQARISVLALSSILRICIIIVEDLKLLIISITCLCDLCHG